MEVVHHLIFLAGALGFVSVLAGLFTRRAGAPLLLVFLGLGMLAGEDGIGGIRFDDFWSAYLVGSVALAIILFEGGLKVDLAGFRDVLAPAGLLATLGVVVTTGLVGLAIREFLGAPWPLALIVGAVVAPTDAAAVLAILRHSRVSLPERVTALLELESGLNDPMAVFITVLLTEYLLHPAAVSATGGLALFGRELVGGVAFGIVGGYGLLWLLRRLHIETALYPVVSLMAALLLFGAAQSVEASGFLAVYLAGAVIGTKGYHADQTLEQFFEAFGWLAQVTLFLILGLLVTPRDLFPEQWPALVIAPVLILAARPLACGFCLLPFGFSLREIALSSWIGLRGAVPIYLSIIPLLAGVKGADIIFDAAFVIVVISLIVQGWTVGIVGRLLGYRDERPASRPGADAAGK